MSETVPLLLSGVNHHAYCPRRFAWIHLEGTFADNEHTTRGVLGHARVDSGAETDAEGVRVLRSVDLWSDTWGIVGRADVVEILPDGTPQPVEYKAGALEAWENDDLQVTAQAVCLEEMFHRPVPQGAIYHIATRRRRAVQITPVLRERLCASLTQMRAILDTGVAPPTVLGPRCRGCSLRQTCLPEVTAATPAWLFSPLPEPS